jgi:hypothetical protein
VVTGARVWSSAKLDYKRRRIGLRDRLASALYRNKIHAGRTNGIGRNNRLKLVAVPALRHGKANVGQSV